MISWTRLLKLHPQLFCNLFSSSYLSKKRPKPSSKPPFLEGLETRLTPANPTVLSILRNSGTLVSTTASYAVSFSESVSGVDSSDFTCITTGGASFNSLSVSGSGSAYTVTISGISGNGTIALKLVDNDSIVNSASQPLGGANTSGISFSSKTDYSTGGTAVNPSGPHSITTGLVNSDGFIDIITANRFNNKTSTLLGVGDGTFNPQTSFATGTEPQGVAAADINGDGKLDIITANLSSDTATILLGNGNNTFTTKPTVATQSMPLSIVLGDFNADSKPDIATANYGSNSISILLGNGNGTFITATNFSTGGGPKSITMGDVNGDGILDLATANFSGSLSLLIGNGDGSFKTATPLTAGTRPFSVIMTDINGDSFKDIISVNYNSANVSILIGNGNGTFNLASSVTVGSRPVSVASADLDGDGKIDLIVSNRDSNTASVLAGNGNGTFKTAVNFTTGTTPYSVTIADFNGDSKADFATANEGDNNISIFLNTTNNPSNFTGQIYNIDNFSPTITINSDKSSLKAGETATLTFNLSEPSTDFTSADVTIAGGTLSAFTGSGTSYSATFTPATNSTTPASINVQANTFTDAAGNNNSPASQLSITIDTVIPNLVITSDKSSLKSGETANLTFTLSESSTDFSSTDVTVAGGSLSAFTGSGTSYSATFTPATNSTTPATINVLANTFTDGAGNNNSAASQLSITIDTVIPTVVITSDKASLKAGETANLTFTLSESSTDFASADVTIAGGSLSAFTGSGTSYSATFTPAINSTTPATINIMANTFTDGAGNNNSAASQLSITIDTVIPT
ncbi:MAG: beta strand repeat-containing protein, partial [Gemmataceae bacterium]